MALNRGKVLIADDHPEILEVCVKYLERAGYETQTACDGQEALDALNHFHPDVILLDIMMPKLSGLEVCQTLKSRRGTRNIPVVLITTMTGPEEIVHGLQSGADDYLCKPIRLAELKVRMENLIRRKRMYDVLQTQNEELLHNLGDKSHALADLFTLSLEMNKANTLEDLLAVLAGSVARTMGSQRVAILLPDRKRRTLRIASNVGVPQEIVQNTEIALTDVAEIFRQYFPKVYWTNERSPLAAYGDALHYRDQPLIVAPMSNGNEPVGLVCVTERVQHEFTADDSMVLSYTAQTAAVAIKNRLRQLQVRETQDVTVFALAKLAESRDELTGNHLRRVQTFCRELAEWLKDRDPDLAKELTPDFLDQLWRAAPLHDIGKVGIPDQILLKPARLTPEEQLIMRQHAIMGGKTLEAAEARLRHDSFLTMAKEICYYHHEKWDGSGYPYGLKGNAIPLAARIVACADVYDALTAKRPYKRAFSHQEAAQIIVEGRGSHFDPRIVDAFLGLADRFNSIRFDLQDDVSNSSSSDV